MTREEILNELRRNREHIREEFHAEVVGLFGSYARGDQRDDSDIDVLVEFDDTANFLHLTGLGFFLEDLFGQKVDVAPRRSLRKELASRIMADLIAI
jgi:predicted nucleotidyltransferase